MFLTRVCWSVLQQLLSLQDRLRSKEAELQQAKEEHRCLEGQMAVLQDRVCPPCCYGDQDSLVLAESRRAGARTSLCGHVWSHSSPLVLLQLLSTTVEDVDGADAEPHLQVNAGGLSIGPASACLLVMSPFLPLSTQPVWTGSVPVKRRPHTHDVGLWPVVCVYGVCVCTVCVGCVWGVCVCVY